MATTATSTVGVTFKRGDGASSETFTALGEVTALSFSGSTRDMIDVTHLASTGGYREYIASFRDAGELTLDLNYGHDAHETMLADFEASDSVNYKVVCADTSVSTFSFTGYVSSLGVTANVGEQIKASCTIKISGAIDLSS